MPRNPNKTHCSVPGCRAWAVRGSDPPRCSPHRGRTDDSPGVGAPPGNQNRRIHGFYAKFLHPEEHEELDANAGDTTLDAEIAITRVALRRILAMLLTGATPGPDPRPLDAHEYARFIGLAFQGVGAISRLLRARQSLGGDDVDGLSAIINEALDELGEEWGCDL